MKTLKTFIWIALWLHFLIDLTPLAMSHLEAYAVETAKRNTIDRIRSLLPGEL